MYPYGTKKVENTEKYSLSQLAKSLINMIKVSGNKIESI